MHVVSGYMTVSAEIMCVDRLFIIVSGRFFRIGGAYGDLGSCGWYHVGHGEGI